MRLNARLEEIRVHLGHCLNKDSQRVYDIDAAKAILGSMGGSDLDADWEERVCREEAERLISTAENSKIPFSKWVWLDDPTLWDLTDRPGFPFGCLNEDGMMTDEEEAEFEAYTQRIKQLESLTFKGSVHCVPGVVIKLYDGTEHVLGGRLPDLYVDTDWWTTEILVIAYIPSPFYSQSV